MLGSTPPRREYSFHDTLLALSLGGFHASADNRCLIFAIFATYLHADSRDIDRREEVDDVDPRERLTAQEPTLRMLIFFQYSERFMAGWEV